MSSFNSSSLIMKSYERVKCIFQERDLKLNIEEEKKKRDQLASAKKNLELQIQGV